MIVSVVSLYDMYLRSLFVRLTLPLLFRLLGPAVVSRLSGTQDGDYRGAAIIYCIYTRLTCVHVEPAQLMPSTAPPLPWETHPRYTSGGTRRKGPRLLVGTAAGFGVLFFGGFLTSLIADGPHHYRPACGHKGSSHLSPVHALQFFIAMQVQHSYNSSTNG